MYASNKLDQYLDSFRARLRKLTLLQGAAATVAVLLVVSTIGAWFSVESGFASTTTNVFRVLLVLALAAVVIRYVVDPLSRIKRGISSQVETRVPAFNGRIETYTQMQASNNPFIDLLAEDALKISAVNPVEERISKKELNKAGAILAAVTIVMLYLLIAGPGFLNYSLRNLLAGWAFNDLLPPQSIAVTPGDESVRRGANVRITSVMEGFDPDEAIINIRNADGEWQEVAMAETPLGFEFTFFTMQQDTSYYISSTGLRSPEYAISVVDVPGIENLSLTYNYPEWTERDPETFTEGDINALPDTRVQLTVTTTAPLTAGALVLNNEKQVMSLNGNQAASEFTVLEEGEYYIAALVGGEEVRLSDDFFIRITEDGKPELEITRPGGDYNASNIEEVLTRIEAKDDFNIQSLALQYSVNGGPLQKVELAAGEREITADHMFMLEEMTATATREVTANVGRFNIVLDEEELNEPSAESGPDGAPANEASTGTTATPANQIPLQPGDIVSYYAEASDRSNTVRTDMYFIQIQPFNRRYEQSQLSGGGGGGGGGPQEDEISQRQRQIIVSTWNQVREQQAGDNAGQVEINSKLLADLQKTLAEQAATLTERARARQLDGDPQIEEFVKNMEAAVQSMQPASARLAEVALNDALQPAQQALQHLLRAEAVFNDITLQQQQGGGGGGGGRAGEDLAEMFELEMDRELNQYETGNSVSPQAQQQEAEDIMSQLDELAKRQEQLANNMRNQRQLTDAQRYQQEMLRREAEELQERLDQLQRQQQSQQQQASNQAGQQGQQGQQGQEGQQGQPGQAGQQGQAGQGGQGGQQQAGAEGQEGQQGQQGEQVAQSELQRRMESAIRAMNEAAAGMQGNLSPEEMQRAAEEAQRQLEGASDQIAQDQLAGMQESFANMANLGEEMVRAQERMEQQMQAAAEKGLRERESGDNPNSRGMTIQEEAALAQEKQQLAAQIRNLQKEMLDTMQNYRSQVPAASNELERANQTLAESGLEQAVADAALYIDAGYSSYIVGNESYVTDSMRNLAERLERAQQLAAAADAPGNSDLDRARQQVQDLRAQLQQVAQGGQPGQGQQTTDQPGQPGQPGQEGQQQGQQGQGQQAQAGGQQGGQNNGGGGGNRFGGRNGGPWNGDDNFNGPIDLPAGFYDNVRQFTQTARGAVEDLELNAEEMARMYDLIRELEFQQTNRNDSILAQEYGEMLALIEQLEVGLQIDSDANRTANVRTATSDSIPEQYKESVAEYFRRLSREE